MHKNLSKPLLKVSRLDAITVSCDEEFCTINYMLEIWGIGDFSVWPIRYEPFRSRDFSVLVVSVSRHFGQNMKFCRNLTCSFFNANVLKSTKGLIQKNYEHDPKIQQLISINI